MRESHGAAAKRQARARLLQAVERGLERALRAKGLREVTERRYAAHHEEVEEHEQSPDRGDARAQREQHRRERRALQPAAQDARKLEELAASQTTLGGTGGLIPVGVLGDCVASRTSATFQVCGNGWKVNLSDFIDNAELTTFANSLPN